MSLELLNDATFLLEAHVMSVSDVTTPLRQLYFIIQIMLMNPADTPAAADMFTQAMRTNRKTFGNPRILAGLDAAEQLVRQDRKFEALKTIRTLLPVEAEVLCKSKDEVVGAAA
jgi:flagellar protein FlbT